MRGLLPILIALCASACGSEHGAGETSHARVCGTVIDGSTGEPLAGAAIVGPGGAKTRSDERGWFVLEGLSAGASGEVRATVEGGVSGVTPLRELAPGELQIVVRVP